MVQKIIQDSLGQREGAKRQPGSLGQQMGYSPVFYMIVKYKMHKQRLKTGSLFSQVEGMYLGVNSGLQT